mgnify:CR=1 FL=1
MINLCMCGAEASYPHAADCPRALFNAPVGSLQEETWIADRERLRAGDLRYRYGHDAYRDMKRKVALELGDEDE